MVKLSAARKFDEALTEAYLSGLRQERDNAEDAIRIVKQILSGETQENRASMKRKEVSVYLGVFMDTLRNWKRKRISRIPTSIRATMTSSSLAVKTTISGFANALDRTTSGWTFWSRSCCTR